MSSCVFCGGKDNLNTSFTITIDGSQKIAVLICDEHAETATVKTAKDAYLDKQRQIEEVLEKAKALGLNLSTQASGLVIAQAPATLPTVQSTPMVQPIPAQPVIAEGAPNVLPTEVFDAKTRAVVTNDYSTQAGIVSGHASHDLSKTRGALPHDALKGNVQLTVVEGRGGQPLAIPAKRQDGLGTTRVRVAKSDDHELQRRFKNMATDTIQSDRVPNFARRGYEVAGSRTCPLCSGNCEVMSGGQIVDCPKCKGAGEISVY